MASAKMMLALQIMEELSERIVADNFGENGEDALEEATKLANLVLKFAEFYD